MNKLTFESVQAMHQAGKLEDAKAGYLTLLNQNPKDVAVLHMLAILYAEEEKFETAEEYLQKAIAIKPDDATLYLHLANIKKAHLDYQGAIDILKQLIQTHPTFAAAENNLATIFFALENYDDAIKHYQRAIEKQTNYVDAYYNLGLALIKNKRFLEAKNVFQSLLDLVPEHPGAHFQLGRLLMQAAKYTEAIKHFLFIADVHPVHFETQVNLGTCYLRLNDLANAERHYQFALEIIPRDVQVLFNLGVIAMQHADVNKAIHYYTETVKIDNDHFDAHNNLGVAYLALNDSQNALTHFQEALRIKPENIALKHTVRILSGDKSITTSPPDYIRELFNSYADHYEAHLTNLLHYEVPKHLFELVNQEFPKRKFKKMLDLGCGTGLCGEFFKPYVEYLIGVDLSEQMLAKAHEKNIYDALIQKDVNTFLQETRKYFDLIVAGDVLVYFGDLDAVFARVNSRLNEHGFFLFNTEINLNEDFIMTDSGRFAHHKNYLDKLASKHGFRISFYQKYPMRSQKKEIVEGHFYLLEKTSSL